MKTNQEIAVEADRQYYNDPGPDGIEHDEYMLGMAKTAVCLAKQEVVEWLRKRAAMWPPNSIAAR